MSRLTIKNIPGQSLKPNNVTSQGQVLFTQDGTNEVIADQITCEAYG